MLDANTSSPLDCKLLKVTQTFTILAFSSRSFLSCSQAENLSIFQIQSPQRVLESKCVFCVILTYIVTINIPNLFLRHSNSLLVSVSSGSYSTVPDSWEDCWQQKCTSSWFCSWSLRPVWKDSVLASSGHSLLSSVWIPCGRKCLPKHALGSLSHRHSARAPLHHPISSYDHLEG